MLPLSHGDNVYNIRKCMKMIIIHIEFDSFHVSPPDISWVKEYPGQIGGETPTKQSGAPLGPG